MGQKPIKAAKYDEIVGNERGISYEKRRNEYFY